MIALVQTLLLSAHLLAVDVAMAGPIYALWLARRRRRRGDVAAGELGRWLMHRSWQALALGMVLGLAMGSLLYFSGGQRFFPGLIRLPASRLYFGVGELAFYFVLVMCCGFGWDWLLHRPWLQALLAIAASSNLIMHFPPLFVSVSILAARPPADATLTSAEFRQLICTPEVLAQVTHHVVSAVAVVGALLMAYSLQRDKSVAAGDAKELSNALAPSPSNWIGLSGARLALGATLMQIPVGLWVLAALPPGGRAHVLGSDLLTTGLFLAAMAATLAMLHFLSSAALGDARRSERIVAISLLVLVVLLMTGALKRIETSRIAAEVPHHAPSTS